MSYLYVPGLEDSTSESSLLLEDTPAPFVTWNEKPISARVWRRECKKGTFTPLQSTLTSKPSAVKNGLMQFIASQQDILASHFPQQVGVQEKATPDTFGLKYCECGERAKPHSCSVKMYEGTFRLACEKCLRIWPASGSMRNGICLARRRRGRLTSARGCSYLPTPTARDWRNDHSAPAALSRKSPNLPAVIGGPLNPRWVEWLMGWILGWSGCEPLEMGSVQRWRLAHGLNSHSELLEEDEEIECD